MQLTIHITEPELAMLRAQARHWLCTGETAPVTEITRRILAAAPPIPRRKQPTHRSTETPSPLHHRD